MEVLRLLRRDDVATGTAVRATPAAGARDRMRMTRGLAVLLALASTFGVALRFEALMAPRSLWLDEAMLATNICGRSIRGLWGPLDYLQSAPFGFLVLERLAVLGFGNGEWTLRLVPFLASLVAMALIYRFCRDQLGASEAVIGVALAAVTPAMIYYAAEAKQYSLDLAVGLLLVTMAAEPLRAGLTPRRAAGLATVGAVSVWCSHPAPFFLAGAGTALIVREALRGRRVAALGAVGISACWAASFLAHYLLVLRELRANAYMATFWADAFLPFPPTSPADLRRYVVDFIGLFETMYQNYQLETGIEGRMSVAAAVVGLAGIAVLWHDGRREILALLVLPLGFATVAAMLQQYPLRFRMVLFATGPILLLMAAGLGSALRAPEAIRRSLGCVLLAGATFLPVVQAAQSLLEAPRPHGARPVLTKVAREWRPGDLLLVDEASEPPFRFYRRHGEIDGLDRVEPTLVDSELRDPAQLEAEVARLEGRPRVWLVFTAHMGDPGGREDRFLRLTLDRLGRRLDGAEARGYFALLYDFTRPP